MECQWIHPERNQREVATLGTEPAGPAFQEYGVKPEVADRVVADLGASNLALDAFSSETSAHLRVCEKSWSAQDCCSSSGAFPAVFKSSPQFPSPNPRSQPFN